MDHRRSRPAALRTCLSLAALAGVAAGCVAPARLVPAAAPEPCGRIAASPPASPVAPHWWRPDAAVDGRALARSCREVGPIVRTGASLPAPRVDRLAIVSWNLDAGRGDVAALVADLRGGLLTGDIAPDAVVLLLQEARRWQGGGEPLTSLSRGTGLHLYYVPSVRHRQRGDDRGGDRGNAILSTLPLLDPAVVELPFERQRRVAIAATIAPEVGGAPVPLRLVNVHLENRAGRRRAWIRSRAARTRQAEALAQVLPRGGALVLGGDLNTWSGNEAAVRVLAERFDPWPAGAADDRATFGRVRIDYLFRRLPASASMTYRRLERRYGSDHAPIVGLVRWAAPRAGT